MLPPNRIQSNITNKRTKKASSTKFDNNSHPDVDVKRPCLTSFDLKTTHTKDFSPETSTKDNVKHISNRRTKNVLRAESMHENVEINDEYLDEILF